MTRREPNWDELRTFRQVMRDGSLSGAARRLGVSQPTAGRHIDALEAALGLPLFARSPRGLTATEAARHLAPHVEAMASASAAFTRFAAGEIAPDRGVVRVAASEIVGCEVLPALLASFRAEKPGVVVELTLSNRNEDLSRRDADIAVRMARPTQQTLVARRIGETRIGLYAHKAYLERFGEPKSLEDLPSHKLIGYDRDDRAFRALGGFASRLTREDFAFRCDSDPAQLAALRAGVGIGGGQENVLRRSPDLVRLLAEEVSIPLEMWLAMHEDVKSTPRVRALFEHLAAGLAGYLRGGDAVVIPGRA